MPKPNRMMEPELISKTDLIKLGEVSPAIKKYVTAIMPLLDNSAESMAGTVEVRNEGGLPVLRFSPRRVPLADLIKNKI